MNYQRYIRDGLLCWTLTSNGYKYLTWNLAKMWSAVMSQPLVIVCADKSSYSFLRREGVAAVILVEKLLPDFGHQIVPFGSKNFMALNRLKLRLLKGFADDAAVERCVYLDGDIAVYKNFLGDIEERLKQAPLWLQCDEQQREGCAADISGSICTWACTGLIAFRHGTDPRIFHIDEALWTGPCQAQDQPWVNKRMAEYGVEFHSLPRNLYPNGARAAFTHSDPARKEEAFILHYNYRVGESKRADMKRFGDWKLPY